MKKDQPLQDDERSKETLVQILDESVGTGRGCG